MDILNELRNMLKTARSQFTYTSNAGVRPARNTCDVYFTNNFEQKAKEWGLTERDALDVYYHGEDRKPSQRCRTYNGYELCIYYGQNSRSGQPYISTIWKRDRR